MLRVVLEYCDEKQRHCQQTPGMEAIGREWGRASNRILAAIGEIET